MRIVKLYADEEVIIEYALNFLLSHCDNTDLLNLGIGSKQLEKRIAEIKTVIGTDED